MLRASTVIRFDRRVIVGFATLLATTLPFCGAQAPVVWAAPNASDMARLATASVETRGGVAHITLDLIDSFEHVTKREGNELIIWFDQPRQFDLRSLANSAGMYLEGVRVPVPGPSQWLVIDLAPNSDVLAERELGDRLVITLGSRQVDLVDPAVEDVPATQQAKIRSLEKPSDQLPRLRSEPDRIALAKWTQHGGLGNDGEIDARSDVDKNRNKQAAAGSSMAMTRPAVVSVAGASPAAVTASAQSAGEKPARRLLAATAEATTNTQAGTLPGQFEVDEMALDRALERTLTREGAVLMPFGMFELEPSLTYTHRELDTPALINLFGFPGFGEANITRKDYTAAVALRAGLPFDAQLEIDAPFTYVTQSEKIAIGFDPVNTVDDDAGAFGDLGVGLAKTLLKEGIWLPDIVARVRWDSQTGTSANNDIAFGGGRHELTGSLSLVKSQDPLAFFSTVAYEETFEENDLDPGNRIGISMGTVLAASPETSLRAALRQDFIGDAEFQGDTIEGTDQVAATLSIGASSVLGKGVLVDAAVDVGLTGDAADYVARISFPLRLDARPILSPITATRRSSDEIDGGRNNDQQNNND